jgi:WD40 repeat protein
MRQLVLGVALAALLVPSAQAASQRLLYTADWSGSAELYSAPLAGTPAQLTFDAGRSFTAPVPSSDGKWVLFGDAPTCSSAFSLYVARPDGSGRRIVARLTGCGLFENPVWSPDSRRIAYSLAGSVYVMSWNGRGRRLYMRGDSPAWSPDGRTLASRVQDGVGRYSLLTRTGNTFRTAATNTTGAFAWSPKGTWIAVGRAGSTAAKSRIELVRANGAGRRPLVEGFGGLKWSADGRFLTVSGSGDLTVFDLSTGRKTALALRGPYVWSHRRSRLAFDGRDGLSVYDAASGRITHLNGDHARELAWRPDDGAVAYVLDRVAVWQTSFYANSDLRQATLAGVTRTLVASAGAYGGSISGVAWAVPRGRLHYRAPAARTLANVSANDLVAPWPITRIAADGGRIAYSTGCSNVFVWTPATSDVRQVEPQARFLAPCDGYFLFDLALAGDRVSWGVRVGNMGQSWAVFQQRVGSTSDVEPLATANGANGCINGDRGFGNLVGSGDLLVFSRWQDEGDYAHTPCAVITRQDVYRADAAGCPCPQLATSPGPLMPTDVDGGRVVAVGRNETLVLDRNGAVLATVPVAALTAQISGGSVVVLLQSALREYDAASGALLHTWPLPDVPSGGECANPHPLGCASPRLLLEDVARGHAAYVLDGQVHLVDLRDGRDAVAATGTRARFIDAGLVSMDGARLHLTPDTAFPK